jgi:hypothetical protein
MANLGLAITGFDEYWTWCSSRISPARATDRTDDGKDTDMRAELEAMAAEVGQSVALLRRRL